MSLNSEVRDLVRDIIREELEVVVDLDRDGDLIVTIYMNNEELKFTHVPNKTLKQALQ